MNAKAYVLMFLSLAVLACVGLSTIRVGWSLKQTAVIVQPPPTPLSRPQHTAAIVQPPTPLSRPQHATPLLLKTHDASSSWTMWPRDIVISSSNPDQVCRWVTFKSTSGAEAQMCVHSHDDAVSGHIARHGRWGDCDKLPKLWPGTDEHYVEVGVNIGGCLMEMLLSTNAKIVGFEPNPINQFCITSTLMRLDQQFRDRVFFFPVALGAKESTSAIHAAIGNYGNSVVGKIIKDTPDQQFLAPVEISVIRGDYLLDPTVPIPLMKLDAQGFECYIFDGMGAVLYSIAVIKMELADHWLSNQPGCSDQAIVDVAIRYDFAVSDGGKRIHKIQRKGVYDILLDRRSTAG